MAEVAVGVKSALIAMGIMEWCVVVVWVGGVRQRCCSEPEWGC